jgi:anti-sigma B factor antagonist
MTHEYTSAKYRIEQRLWNAWRILVPREGMRRTPEGKVMDITIDERLIGSVTVLDLAGRLTMAQAAQHLKDKINSLVSQQRTEIVVNLRNVPYIDSGGLGQLVASFASVRKAGGVLTRLVTVFESFDSEAEAVQSFQTVARPAASH